MARCIIHIGMPKTGSTSVQQSLRRFADDNFVYPELTDSPNHILPVLALFTKDAVRHFNHRLRDPKEIAAYCEAAPAIMKRAIEESRGRNLIISAENIGSMKPEGLRSMRDYFLSYFDEISVVGYVRSPAGYMISAFQQRVKQGSQPSFNPDVMYRPYGRSFSKLDNVFGRERVQLWKFDPGQFPGGCVVRDFCARVGISSPPARIVRRNDALSRQAVCLLYAYRKFLGNRTVREIDWHGRLLGRLVAGLGNDKFRLSPELIRPLIEKNRADIEWMEARLGQSLREELGQYQPGDIRDEADLLRPDPVVARRIIEMLGDRAPAGVTGETPEQVGQLVDALRAKFADQRKLTRARENSSLR